MSLEEKHHFSHSFITDHFFDWPRNWKFCDCATITSIKFRNTRIEIGDKSAEFRAESKRRVH